MHGDSLSFYHDCNTAFKDLLLRPSYVKPKHNERHASEDETFACDVIFPWLIEDRLFVECKHLLIECRAHVECPSLGASSHSWCKIEQNIDSYRSQQ